MTISKAIKNLFYFKSNSVYNSIMTGTTRDSLIKSSVKRRKQGDIMSLTAKLARHLLKGNEVTAAEIEGKFGLANPQEAVRQLRLKGYAVYGNKKTLWDGSVTTKYRIGTPSRAMVAAAYQVAGADLF
jgi:hypothetical protein